MLIEGLIVFFFYLYGSIPFSILLSRGKVKQLGVGLTFQEHGLVVGLINMFFELTKALLPILLINDNLVLSLSLIAVVIGDSYPFFGRYKGSFGRTIVMWSLLFLSPLSALILVIVALTSLLLFKNAFYYGKLLVILIPLVFYLVTGNLALTFVFITHAVIDFIKIPRGAGEVIELSKIKKEIVKSYGRLRK